MLRILFGICLVSLILLPTGSGSALSLADRIIDPSFEGSPAWLFANTGQHWQGGFIVNWFSNGIQSYQLSIPGGCSGSGIYPGENTYAEVYQQNVDLTGIQFLDFDLSHIGSWDVPGLGPNFYLSSEVWIDDTKVYGHDRGGGTMFNQRVDTTAFTGLHRLAFRMQIHANYCSSQLRAMRVDDIHLVVDQVFLPMVTVDNNP